jgi:peroxiredoxin
LTSPQPTDPEAGATNKAWLPPVAAVLVVAVGIAFALLREQPDDPVARGVEAPEFDLPLLGASPKRITLDDIDGQVVLLNFWATWCKPCEDEMPAMDRLYRALQPEGFEMLAVSVDEETALVERFQERLGVSFPILLDPAKEVSERYQTTGFPESLLIDKNGMIVERYIGPRDWDHTIYAERIRKLLKER